MKRMLLAAMLSLTAGMTTAVAQEEVRCSVQKIWDNGTYNAFTSRKAT